jgi:SAM-dependent methyltransferase
VTDPRARAREKFAGPPQWSGFDLLARCATDPPLAIATLLGAVAVDVAAPRICELGFGSGWLLDQIARAQPRAALVGLDQSASYVGHARDTLPRVRVVRGDMEALPFAPASFDVIVTCWTLYFMRDIDAALSGMKRCLRPGGRLVAATVAPDHMLEHEEMCTEAVRAASHAREPDVGARFDLESGAALMHRQFASVELREWTGVLTLPDIESAMQVWRAYTPDGLPADVDARARDEYGRIASEYLRRKGVIRVRRHDGAFVARL